MQNLSLSVPVPKVQTFGTARLSLNSQSGNPSASCKTGKEQESVIAGLELNAIV
jgi:hypothetical protein